MSSFKLNEHHISLLSKGLSFCPTPGEPDIGEIRRDMDEFHRKVLLKSHFEKDIPKMTAWQDQMRRDGNGNTPNTSNRNVGVALGPFSDPKFTKKSNFVPANRREQLKQ